MDRFAVKFENKALMTLRDFKICFILMPLEINV